VTTDIQLVKQHRTVRLAVCGKTRQRDKSQPYATTSF